MRKREGSGAGGFTLIEILIAIMIVGIIATALVPMMSDYAQQAKAARLLANVVELEKAMDRYAFDHAAPLGYVLDDSVDPPTLVEYRQDGGVGFQLQLESPTDKNGNVMGDAIVATPGPFSHGPYMRDKPGSASILLGASAIAKLRGFNLLEYGIQGTASSSMIFSITVSPKPRAEDEEGVAAASEHSLSAQFNEDQGETFWDAYNKIVFLDVETLTYTQQWISQVEGESGPWAALEPTGEVAVIYPNKTVHVGRPCDDGKAICESNSKPFIVAPDLPKTGDIWKSLERFDQHKVTRNVLDKSFQQYKASQLLNSSMNTILSVQETNRMGVFPPKGKQQ